MADKPTDEALENLFVEETGFDTDDFPAAIFGFARAVLAKWGTPAPVGAEPLAYLHDDGYWTAAKNDAGRRLNDRLLFAGSPKVAVYTTPQPTQAQAVAEPLTPDQIAEIADAARKQGEKQ